jgi:hypothetical protein
VFRDCNGRRLDRRVLMAPQVVREEPQVAQRAGARVAPCAGAAGRKELDGKWFAPRLHWFDSRGGRLVLEQEYREAMAAELAKLEGGTADQVA